MILEFSEIALINTYLEIIIDGYKSTKKRNNYGFSKYSLKFHVCDEEISMLQKVVHKLALMQKSTLEFKQSSPIDELLYQADKLLNEGQSNEM